MSASYGSDNPDCVRVDHLGEDGPGRSSSSSKWKKAALVTAGAAMCIGGALVMYEGWNAPLSATVTGSASPLTEMNLESAAVSTDQTNLMSGQPVLLRVKDKANLCADDGGATKADETFFTGQPCNPSNPNQLFIYDSVNNQFKSANKANLCIDDGGGWAGLTWLRLSKCNTKSADQRFTYDPSTLMLANPSKKGYCVSDGGGDAAGASHYTIWSCTPKSENQHFEVLSQSVLMAEQKAILDAVAGGAKFILRIAGKDGLCASGAGPAGASTSFVPATCDKQSKNQLFTYDASAKRIVSAEKKGLCLDDGGYKKTRTDVRLSGCSSNTLDQTFTYDAATMMFSQPNKAKMCLDDGSAIWFATPRLILKECDPYSRNQHFEYVLQTDPVIAAPVSTTTISATPATATSAVDTSVTTTPAPVVADTTTASSTQVSAASTTQQTAAATTYETPAAASSTATQSATQTAYLQEPTTAPQQSQYSAVSAFEPDTTSTVTSQTAATTTNVMMPQKSETTASTVDMEPNMAASKQNDVTAASTTSMMEPGMKQNDVTSTSSTSMMEPGMKENDMTSTTSMMEPGMKEKDMTATSTTSMMEPGMKENDMTATSTTSMMEPGMKENDMTSTTSMMEPGMKENDMTATSTTSMMEPGMKENDMTSTSTTSMLEPGTSTSKESDVTSTTSMVEPDTIITKDMTTTTTTPDVADMMNIAAKDLSNSIPATSAITNMDASVASFVGNDWNLLAPFEITLTRVDKENAPVVPVANIFQYLQSLKDRADLEHEAMMYRYKRTFECVTEGLKKLADDVVTTDEYKVLVRWMYDHCAAGNTEIETPNIPDLPINDIKSADVTPLVNDAETDVKRQFMTKLDFYYEIKSYFAERSEKLNGEVAAIRLRSEETKELEKKMIDCIDEASERFGFQGNSQAYATTEHLKAAIAWVDDSCMTA